MPIKQSAGILLYKIDDEIQFFLVHPGGPLWKNKDEGAWTIPKGEFTNKEDALTAAIREFEEETGKVLQGNFIELKPIKQKGGKIVFAWAVESFINADEIVSNTFEIEWPPRSGRRQSFVEIDKAGWFKKEDAIRKINPSQISFFDELIFILSNK